MSYLLFSPCFARFWRYGLLMLLFCILGTLQAYISFFHLFHNSERFSIELLLESTYMGWQSISHPVNDYHFYHSWLDIIVAHIVLLVFTVPLIFVYWFFQKHPKILWALFLSHVVLSWFYINLSIFADLEASWSTYELRDLVIYTFDYSKYWLMFNLSFFILITYRLLHRICYDQSVLH